MRCLALALIVYALPTVAIACVQPSTEVALVGIAPADGATGVPIDAGIIFDVRFTEGTLSEPDHRTGYIEDVTVRAGDVVVPGTLSVAHAVGVLEQARYDQTHALQVIWIPDAPLAPATEHTVEFTLVPSDCNECADETTTNTFTTSDANVEPLVVEAAASLTPARRRFCTRETPEDECERFRCQEYTTDTTLDTLHIDVGFANLPLGAVTRVSVGPQPDRMTVESPALRSSDRQVIIRRDEFEGDAVCVQATVIDAMGREATRAFECFDVADTEPLPNPPSADGDGMAGTDDCSASGDGSGNPLIAGILILGLGLRRRRS